MQVQFDQIVSQSKVKHTFSGFLMHEFILKKKNTVAQGNCLVLQWLKQNAVQAEEYLKMSNFDLCKKINNSTFIKVKYLKSTSFIFFNDFHQNALYSLSLPNTSAELSTFQEILKKKGVVIDYLSPDMQSEIKDKIDNHIDNVLENQISINFTKVVKIGKAIGNFFGKINKKIVQQTGNLEQKFQKNIVKASRESFSEATISKWDKFKEKASQLNDKVSTLVKPINESIATVATGIGQKIQTSQNTYVKYVVNFAKQTQSSINQGFYVQPPAEVKQQNSQLPILSDNKKQMMNQVLVNEQTPDF